MIDSIPTIDDPNLFDLIFRQKLFAGFFILLFIMLVIELIRRRALKERYAILWIIASTVLLPLVLSTTLVSKVSNILGIAYTPLSILLTGVLFLILINLHFSVALSRHRENETKLAIRLTEQQEEINNLKKTLSKVSGKYDLEK